MPATLLRCPDQVSGQRAGRFHSCRRGRFHPHEDGDHAHRAARRLRPQATIVSSNHCSYTNLHFCFCNNSIRGTLCYESCRPTGVR
jgi:hypothetical protein